MNVMLLLILAQQGSSGFNFEDWIMGIVAVLVVAVIGGLLKIYTIVQHVPEQLSSVSNDIKEVSKKVEDVSHRVNDIDRDVAILKDWRERADRQYVRDVN